MEIKTLKQNIQTETCNPSSQDGPNCNPCLPPQYKTDYEKAIDLYAKRYDFLADGFHLLYGEPSYSWQDFLHYMKDFMGFEITVTYFANPADYVVAGIWYWDSGEKKGFTIFINPLAPDTNITIAHECVHALQDLDIDFQQELQNYPIPLQMRIADRVAEISAIQIFMPREKVACDRLAGLNVYDIALKYGVSKAIAAY